MGETVDGRLLALRSIPRKRRFEAPGCLPSSLAKTQSYLVLSQAAGLKRRQDAGACGCHEYGEWREASRKKGANIKHHCCEDGCGYHTIMSWSQSDVEDAPRSYGWHCPDERRPRHFAGNRGCAPCSQKHD